MDSALTSFQIDPATLAMPVVLAALAALVAIRLADRARFQQGPWLRIWLTSAGLALGAGIWGTHFATAMAVRTASTSLGFDFPYALGALGAGVGFSVAALLIAHHYQGVFATVTGSVLAATGALATHYLGLLALQVTPTLHWDTSGLAGSGAVVLALCVGAFLLFFHAGSFSRLAASQRQIAASALLAAGLIGMLLVSFSGVFVPNTLARPKGAPPPDELLWAITIGSLSVVLLLLLVASLVDANLEARIRSLTESLRSARTKLSYLAGHDASTRLINRAVFDQHLARAVQEAEQRRRQCAVLFVELDDFRMLNGAWGPAVGDQVLLQVAARLKNEARNGHTVARIGWDQFVVLLPRVESPQLMSTTAQRLVSALARPMDTPHGPVRLTCSIGIAPYPVAGPLEHLIPHAHAAMLAARQAGGNTFRFADSKLEPGGPELATLQQELRLALEHDELELHYQPVVDAGTLKPCAVEALIRWRHPTRGLLQPDAFLPAAERFELSRAIGEWVLKEAAAQMALWAEMGLALRLSVNVFASQVRVPGLVDQLVQAHRRHGIAPGMLALDVAEPVLLSEAQATERLFAALREAGLAGSVDDFGHTHCNLMQLRSLRPREVKVDRSLVAKLESSADALAIVDAVIRLAHALDIRVVAKGVETPRQGEILQMLKCDELQGRLFAQAMPAADLSEYLMNRLPAGAAPRPAAGADPLLAG